MVVNQNRYNCMVQCIMHSKAMTYGHTDIAVKVLCEQNPAEQRKLGKKVTGFVQGNWRRDLRNRVHAGLEGKVHPKCFLQGFSEEDWH